MNAVKTVAKALLHLVIVWFIDTVSLLLTAIIFPGITITPTAGSSELVVAAAGALVLGIVNLLVRPIILLLAIPLGFVAVFIVGFLVNAVALLITAGLLPGFGVDGFLSAILGGLVLSAINTIITTILLAGDDDSFYQGVVERLAARSPYPMEDDPAPGLIMMEIDGLSYWHLKKALAEGLMPTLSEMIEKEGYVLSHVDCGLPSQTSACQAGIMFGDNYDIPAFRWYDKDQGKLMVSGHDAAEINARYARGNGLMRGGTSINNMMNGDAANSLLTLADIMEGDGEEKRQRADAIYLLMVNPYFFMRTLVLFFAEVVVELWEGWKQRRADVQPRLNRLHGGYPFIRAATTVFMRDVSAYLTLTEIIRGTPVLYVTWPGYDEVAHHSGPWTTDAFKVLSRYDKTIRTVREYIEKKAPRPYELIILSDHGQSFGATFLQRYGFDLKTFIESRLPAETSVVQSSGGDEGSLSVGAMAAELANVQDQGKGGIVGGAVLKQTKGFLEKRSASDVAPPPGPANVTVCGSGNIAQVYFDLYPRKITISELNAVYPGMVDALVQHEGVGFVVGYEDTGEPAVFGKKGARNLHTGEVVGEDPLAAYGEPDFRARQVRRIADFPHAGDLIVNSTLFPDGTVAAMEELIGNHGGLGGEQTDAFLFHPADLDVPRTSNSADVFAILDARRDRPPLPAQPAPEPQAEPEVDDWSWATLSQGFARTRGWVGKMLRAMVLDRNAYREIVADPYMTGPALFIGVLFSLVAAIVVAGGLDPAQMAGRVGIWVVDVVIIFLAARILGGEGSFTATLRGLGFAHAVYLYEIIGLIPVLSDFARIVTVILTFMAVWIAAVEAHKLRGWRSLIFPIVAILVPVIGLVILSVLAEGAAFTLDTFLSAAGVLSAGPN